jgi:sugar phosphate isomerase/epimerase
VNKLILAPTTLPAAPPLEYIEAARRAGFDGIGLRLYRSPGIDYAAFHPVAGDVALMSRVKAAVASSGLEVVDILSFYLQPEIDFESMQAPLAFGAELGATYALVIGDDPEWDRMVDSFGRFCDAAAAVGLTASLEAPVVQRQVKTLGQALDLIAATRRANAVICLDPFHFHGTGDSADLIRQQDPRLFPYSQLDDGDDSVPAPAGRCPIGAGKVDLAAILDALPPDLPLSVEFGAPPRRSDHTAAAWAQIAYDSARAFLDAYHSG